MSSNASSSYLTPELAVTLAVVAAGIGYGYYARAQQHATEAGSSGVEASSKASGNKKGGKKKNAATAKAGGGSDEGAATPQVVPFPAVLSTRTSSIPGGFDGAAEDADSSDGPGSQVPSKSKKGGKKAKRASKVLTSGGAETPRPTVPHIPNSTSAPAIQESDADVSSASALPPPGPEASQSEKKSKKKKSKAKKATAEQHTGGGHAMEGSTASITIDTDSSWTHVGTKKGGSKSKSGAKPSVYCSTALQAEV